MSAQCVCMKCSEWSRTPPEYSGALEDAREEAVICLCMTKRKTANTVAGIAP